MPAPRINKSREAKKVAEWNKHFPAGSLVQVWRTTRRDDLKCVAPTRSDAFVADSGVAVIFVEGVAGYWALDCITPAPKGGVA